MDKATDKQVGGRHYKDMKIQPVDYIVGNGLSFLEGNVVKYITRHKAKHGAEDIKKVIHYCEMILETEYKENNYDRPSETSGNRGTLSAATLSTLYSVDIDTEWEVRDDRFSVYGNWS